MKTIVAVLAVIVAIGCGYDSSHRITPAQPGVIPVIAQLSPPNTTAGGPAFTLTVNGSSFAGGAIVNWNGTQPATTFVSSKQLTAAIPASAIASAGTATVTVTNPGTPVGPYGGGTQSETSNSITFTIQ
jgi:hypothetical protein